MLILNWLFVSFIDSFKKWTDTDNDTEHTRIQTKTVGPLSLLKFIIICESHNNNASCFVYERRKKKNIRRFRLDRIRFDSNRIFFLFISKITFHHKNSNYYFVLLNENFWIFQIFDLWKSSISTTEKINKQNLYTAVLLLLSFFFQNQIITIVEHENSQQKKAFFYPPIAACYTHSSAEF